MIVGMRVKNIVAKDQMVQREDGLDMTVAELMEDRLEVKRSASPQIDVNQLSRLGAPSSGMWPEFSVRFGGGPMKPGALGFSGGGQICYQGDELRIKGNRRNANLGMSRQEERIPLAFVANSTVDGCFIEIALKPGVLTHRREGEENVRIECVTAAEANELKELISLPGAMPTAAPNTQLQMQ
ncbi:MAG: hypothetical protein EAZ37_15265 [Burkholderiales bacterium]|nr:MAG: hypothetical protein EAZ37_15265 [Burkholderiales bacterium]